MTRCRCRRRRGCAVGGLGEAGAQRWGTRLPHPHPRLHPYPHQRPHQRPGWDSRLDLGPTERFRHCWHQGLQGQGQGSAWRQWVRLRLQQQQWQRQQRRQQEMQDWDVERGQEMLLLGLLRLPSHVQRHQQR